MISKVTGIIITETPYGDNSKVINVLTKEHGIIGVMAKGVKSIKNPLRSKVSKLAYGYFHINYNENKLSTLIDIDILDNFKNIKSDITLISYASYLTELTYQVVKQNSDEEIYNIYTEALLKINANINPDIITNIVELKYLDYLGVGLNLDSCIKCGNKKNIVTLDPDEGGFICQNCYQNEKIISPKSIKLIRMYYLIDIKTISEINISLETAKEINYFLEKYYERYTGLYIKSKNFLKNIKKL